MPSSPRPEARPALSVCLLTAEPAGRIAAVLEPLRDVAGEVLIAADSRVGDATLAGYAALADRLMRVEFRLYERHLAWLQAQCTGDWILRLDGDEVVSAALARRLPELIRRRDVRQFWIRRAWLYGDGLHVLEDEPWRSDYVNRLVRNDGSLHFAGEQHEHAHPAAPAEWLDEPVYHLDLVTSDAAVRRDKAIGYEVAAPLRIAAGGGRLNEAFYLPELRDRVTRAPVPAEDRPLLQRALAAAPAPAAGPAGSEAALVGLAEMDRFWAPRKVPATAYRATIEPIHPVITAMVPDEGRRVFARVTNAGTERWPWMLEHRPQIRMSYRWLYPDGAVHVADGVRTPFPRTVEPGETVLVAVSVAAPPRPGEYVLQLDVVHDGVTWFGCDCRVPVAVGPPAALPPAGGRLRENGRPARRRGLRRRSSIPRAIHRVWLGDTPMPDAHEEYGAGFAALHPGWTVRLWTDADLPALGIGERERDLARTAAELSNLMRYELLSRFGGVYVDTDVECLRPFDDLLHGVSGFAGLELPGRLGNAVLGAAPGHPVFVRAASLARRTLGLGAHSADANGPYLFTLVVEQEGGIAIHGADRFYPYGWNDPRPPREALGDAHAVHHWTKSWWGAV